MGSSKIDETNLLIQLFIEKSCNDNAQWNFTARVLFNSQTTVVLLTKMLSGIRKSFFYLPLKSLLFIGKLQGLIVFTYETVPEISYSISTFLCTYSCVYTVLIVLSLKILVIRILWGLSNYLVHTKVVFIFVYITENLITAYRVMITYMVQFYYRKNFRSILSEAVHLHQSIEQLMKDVSIFDRMFYRCYLSKVAGVFLQFVGITYIITLYKRITSTMFQSDIVTFTLIGYMHLTAITISGIFYAGMLFILMFYRNLNRKALQIIKALTVVQDNELNCKIRHRLYRRLSNEIDQICCIYGKASAFAKKFNKLFSLQLLFAILNTFFVVLIEVRSFFYIFCHCFSLLLSHFSGFTDALYLLTRFGLGLILAPVVPTK